MWFKNYGGWVIVGLLSAIILYLIFRPVTVSDNKEALKAIDSLTKENNRLRNQLTNMAYQVGMQIEKTTHDTDSLKAQNKVLNFKNDVILDNNISLAKQVQYYKAHKDTIAYDSACDLLATKVLSDSITIQNYQSNTERLIWTMSEAISLRDSLIASQQKVILSDSVLIRTQRELTDTQQKQLNKSEKRAKIVAWIARVLAVVVVSESIILATK